MGGGTRPFHLRVDALGGVAGDMFLAALLDARPELRDEAAALAAAIGPSLTLTVEKARNGGLHGLRVRFDCPGEPRGHVPANKPRHYHDYADALRRAAPDPAVATRATDILRRLGEAEAKVHGVELDAVHFHEVADWDSVADVLLVAWTLERLGIDSASVSPLPLGSGRVMTQHGPMPIPAPATAELLREMPVTDDGIAGERITPTGAAILAHLSPTTSLPFGPHRLVSAGYGLGHRSLDGIANVLRLSLYSAEAAPGDMVGILDLAVDDQTPEDLAVGLDRLRNAAGVLDVLQLPAFGKKGRMTTRIEVLCRPDALEPVARLCLSETTSLGVRMRLERRLTLSREADEAAGVRIKRATRPDGSVSVKAEMDDIAGAGDGAARAWRRRRAEGG